MLSSLTSGVSGLENFQEEMDVIGNNIANVNTTGYKASTVDFASTFSNTLSASGSGETVQVGTGVSISGVNANWAQGSLSSTGIASNLAINGNGFFIVRDPTSGTEYATRAGDFSVDSNGYLVTDNGDRVQGYNSSGLSTIGDIKIDATGSSSTTASLSSYTINSAGDISVTMSDGSSFVRGQVLMQSFSAPQNLTSVGGNLYTNMTAAGPSTGTVVAPGTSGLGTLQSGSVELSNVDLSNEMANLITAQRAFEANSKIITTSDELLQTVVNMVH